MSTPPPPWEAHPPLEDDGFFGAEPRPGQPRDPDDDEEDTGPIRTHVAPDSFPNGGHPRPALEDGDRTDPHRPAARPHDTFADRFTAPLTVDPRTVTVRRTGRSRSGVHPGLIAAGVAALVLVVLVVWLLWPSGDDGATTAAPTPTVDTAAVEKLKDLLPAGYSSDACQPVEAPDGAAAKVECAKNSDVDGPPTANYTLMKDADALSAAMDGVVTDAGIVNCPGNIQSPGPWRRNATPTKVAGNLVCGLPQGKPMVAWTNDASLVLSMTKAGPEGPTLDQLYRWWSNHS